MLPSEWNEALANGRYHCRLNTDWVCQMTGNRLSLYYSRVQITPNLLIIFSSKHRSYHARTAQETMTNLVFCHGWPVDPWMASGGNTWERWLAFQFTSGIGGGHRENTHTQNIRNLNAQSKKRGEFGTGPMAAFGFPSTPIGPAQPMGEARAAALRRHRSRRLAMHRLF